MSSRSSCFLATALGLAAPLALHGASDLSFNRDIRPIFSDKCFACHGTDAKHREGDRRLDTVEGAYADNDGIIAIKPGDLEKSDAWLRIISDDKDEMMPPPKSHKTLSKAEKELIRQWILQGAPYQKHWAFEPMAKPEVPERRAANADRQMPIDGFVAARLAKEKLSLSPEADKATLLRRVTLAITGLPPTPQEVEAFLKDAAPEAYARVVDRLLASPRFGEHMAHWWLDLARYGDTHGLHLDNERQMWLYRDWVIGAFNRNLTFDQFTIEQLAGDQLPEATNEQKIASGFNRCNVSTSEGGAIKEEFLFRYAVDRTATTAQTWLGLTAQCAVCHDHKFDPISQKEFYQLYAFFNAAADPAMDGNKLLTEPILQNATAEQKQQLADYDKKIAQARKTLTAALEATAYTDPAETPENSEPRKVEEVWMEDTFPAGAKPQLIQGTAPLTFVGNEEMPPASGKLAIKRTAKGLAQDYYDNGAAPFVVPADGILSVQVRTDGTDEPKAIMIQFHTGAWKHRAVWGDANAIEFGKAGTTERYAAGPLPSPAIWTQLDVPAEKIGLKPGDKISGYAFTQFDGTVYWDHLAVRGIDDPANDPTRSFAAWLKASEGKDTPNVPADLNKLLKKTAEQRTPEERTKLRDHFIQNICVTTRDAFDPLEKELTALEKQREDFDKSIPATFVMADMEKPRPSFIMERGLYDKPGAPVQPGTPAALPPLKAENARRLDLARWLVSAENPLTARVTVNRFWQQFFGVGLVKTSADFGSQGEPPTHPELLDWLAVSFRESGWDMKRLVKTIVTSATWRQASGVTPELLARDPENRLLARGPRQRLNAEAVRDEALFVSGLLVEKVGGKGVKTYQPPNIWEPVGFAGSNTRNYKQDSGEALYRRSIYTFLKRTAPAPFLSNFDGPAREEFCTRRERSDTPLQALQLLNDVQFFEAARAFAQRVLTEGGDSPETRLSHAFHAVLARPPEPHEAERVRALFDRFLTKYRADAEAAKAVVTNGESKPSPNLDPAELAAWTQIGNLLLNLDENVSIN